MSIEIVLFLISLLNLWKCNGEPTVCTNITTINPLKPSRRESLVTDVDWIFPNDLLKRTETPLFLNLIINLNIMTEREKKQTKKRWSNGRQNRFKMAKGETKMADSERFGTIFERIKLKMENERKKRDVAHLNSKLEDSTKYKLPMMSILEDEREINVSKWLRNWKDVLTVNSVLSTDKPSKPDVEFIDEWKYSYRVTLYKSDAYNVMNFQCSGILISSRWVLTSESCDVGDNVTLLIGVHTLPKNVSKHNWYGVSKRVYSSRENLELLQMDRAVRWNFTPPEIRTVGKDEIENLFNGKKCSLLSWIPVDLGNEIFELRQYPQLTFLSNYREISRNNSVEVSPSQAYKVTKKDNGSPVLCNDVLTGIVIDVDEQKGIMTVEMLCPVMEWVTFFTKENTYYEVSARKITMRSLVEKIRLSKVIWLFFSITHVMN